jgi:hypothetical protein
VFGARFADDSRAFWFSVWQARTMHSSVLAADWRIVFYSRRRRRAVRVSRIPRSGGSGACVETVRCMVVRAVAVACWLRAVLLVRQVSWLVYFLESDYWVSVCFPHFAYRQRVDALPTCKPDRRIRVAGLQKFNQFTRGQWRLRFAHIDISSVSNRVRDSRTLLFDSLTIRAKFGFSASAGASFSHTISSNAAASLAIP